MKTIVYQKNYEEITAGTITYSVHYVYSPDELVAMIVKYDSANVSYEKVYGVVTNHQGSIMALYDTQGKIVWETSYDAWGRERSIAGVSYTSAAARPPWLIRGYTGHEHLAEFGLINMNGRMYDPQVGRMLSPDNFVQDATSTQGYNRYTYVLNNPLRYRDPDGEFVVWSINPHGFSIGVNFTPAGVPLGAGVSVDWSNGITVGAYVEVAYRVGGTGLGTGAGLSLGLNYNFKHNSFFASSNMFVYGSFGVFNVGGSIGVNYNFSMQKWNTIWNIYGGIGYGDEEYGVGIYVSYGSEGLNWSLGGYYDPDAVEVYTSPVSDNYGKENGECALRCFEEFSESYGYNQYDFEYWKHLNNDKLGVNTNDMINMVNETDLFQINRIPTDINNITDAISHDKRVMIAVGDIKTEKYHAGMVQKVKVYKASGRYKIYFAETSPVRTLPYNAYNVIFDKNYVVGYYVFYKK